MALLKDRVKESTTTTGTGTLTLTGAVSGYRRFSAALSNADVTYYCIESGTDWEVGIGTYSANTLTRDTVLASSTGSVLNLTASRSFVFITYAADKAVYENSAGYVQIDSGIYFPDGTTQTTAFGGSVSVSATGISSVPPSSILGNNTASTGYSSGLSPSSVRTLLGLATTSDVTFDIVRATTSVQTPLVNNASAALTLGNSTYGISSPGDLTLGTNKYLWTADGPNILVGKDSGGYYLCGGVGNHSSTIYIGSANSPVKIQSNAVLGGQNAALTLGNATYGVTVPGAMTISGVSTLSGGVTFPVNTWLTSSDTTQRMYFVNGSWTTYKSAGSASYTHIFQDGAGTNRVLFGNVDGVTSYQYGFTAYDASSTKDARLKHDSTNGILSTSSGAIYLSAQNGFVRSYTSGVQSYLQAWDGTLTGTTWITHSGITGELQTNVGALQITTATGVTQLLTSGTNSSLRVYAGGSTKYTAATHNNTDGIISTSSGNLNLVPTGGTVAVTGGITASGNVSYAQGLATGTVTKSANYTTTADDYCVNVTANSIDITFETAVGCANREHEVINTGVGTVTLKTTSSQTISGNASGTLTLTQYQVIRVKSDGINWLIMSRVT